MTNFRTVAEEANMIINGYAFTKKGENMFYQT